MYSTRSLFFPGSFHCSDCTAQLLVPTACTRPAHGPSTPTPLVAPHVRSPALPQHQHCLSPCLSALMLTFLQACALTQKEVVRGVGWPDLAERPRRHQLAALGASCGQRGSSGTASLLPVHLCRSSGRLVLGRDERAASEHSTLAAPAALQPAPSPAACWVRSEVQVLGAGASGVSRGPPPAAPPPRRRRPAEPPASPAPHISASLSSPAGPHGGCANPDTAPAQPPAHRAAAGGPRPGRVGISQQPCSL